MTRHIELSTETGTEAPFTGTVVLLRQGISLITSEYMLTYYKPPEDGKGHPGEIREHVNIKPSDGSISKQIIPTFTQLAMFERAAMRAYPEASQTKNLESYLQSELDKARTDIGQAEQILVESRGLSPDTLRTPFE